jgi:sulfoxide reductase heme-binding subunit YedZ
VLTLGATGATAYWYLTRGTGTVALILLTLSVALGVANIRRLRTDAMPRFVLDSVHRNVSLLAMAFLLVHILTSVLDSFAPISLINAVIPFTGTYRPLWLGLGAVGFDLMLAITITSLLRRRFGYRTWRFIHWTAYISWPVALLHSVGTGSDTKQGWMLVVIGACVIIAVVAVVSRATAGWPANPLPRMGALGASALVPLGLIVWLPSGPLAKDWARRAGTPSSLLYANAASRAASSSGTPTTTTSSSIPFTANASGTVQQGNLGDGLFGVDISLSLAGEQLNTLRIHLRGQPLGDGGLQMTSSTVTLGTSSIPVNYRGTVTGLEGTNIAARVSDPAGRTLNVVARLQIDQNSGTVSGVVSVSQ